VTRFMSHVDRGCIGPKDALLRLSWQTCMTHALRVLQQEVLFHQGLNFDFHPVGTSGGCR